MVMSICKFLAMYYGISLDAGIRYSHKEIKKHFKLRTCSFTFAANNAELVNNGSLVYVRDSYGVIFPYVVPEMIMTTHKSCGYTEVESEKNDPSILKKLSELPTYMVHELLSKYKGSPAFYRVIKNELISRGEYDTKVYKLRKDIEAKECGLNDKYQRRRKIGCKKP